MDVVLSAVHTLMTAVVRTRSFAATLEQYTVVIPETSTVAQTMVAVMGPVILTVVMKTASVNMRGRRSRR